MQFLRRIPSRQHKRKLVFVPKRVFDQAGDPFRQTAAEMIGVFKYFKIHFWLTVGG